jgi:hypothetical protein
MVPSTHGVFLRCQNISCSVLASNSSLAPGHSLILQVFIGLLLNAKLEAGVVMHTCNPTTRETEAGGPQVPGQLGYTGIILRKGQRRVFWVKEKACPLQS